MSRANELLQLGCQELGVRPEDVKVISDALARIIVNSTELTCIATAFQIIQEGGVDNHADTMNPKSVWVLEIYPKLKEAIGDHMARDVKLFLY